MAAHKGPASLRPRCTRSGSSVAAIPVYQSLAFLSSSSSYVQSQTNCFFSAPYIWYINNLYRFLGELAELRNATISFIIAVHLSVSPSSWNYSAATDCIFMRFDIWVRFDSKSSKFNYLSNQTKITGNLREELCTFMIISCRILLWVRYVSGKVVEKIKTHILDSIMFFFQNRAVYEIMWKNVIEPDKP
jgi:hypothetical protein